MVPFSKIYFDTCALFDGGWPRPNLELRTLLDYARVLEVPTLIPTPADREREEQWLREVTVRQAKIMETIGEIDRRYAEIADRLPSPSLHDVEVLRRLYRENANEARKVHSISDCPMTSKTLTDVFELSVQRKAPFQRDKDRNFQDLLVYLSIIEDLRKLGGKPTGAIVTNDKGFQEGFKGIDNQHRVQIRMFRSLNAVIAELQQGFKQQIVLKQERQSENVHVVLSSEGEKIRKHIVGTVQFSDPIFRRLVKIDDIENLRVGSVTLPVEIGEGPFEFFFNVDLDVVATVESFQIPSWAGSAKVGEHVVRPTGEQLLAAFGNPVLSTERIPKKIVVNAKGVILKGKFSLLELGVAYEAINFGFGMGALNEQTLLGRH
jgi:hypothetical protein